MGGSAFMLEEETAERKLMLFLARRITRIDGNRLQERKLRHCWRLLRSVQPGSERIARTQRPRGKMTPPVSVFNLFVSIRMIRGLLQK